MVKTGFIIGAGASVDYGLPTGYQLRESIINSNVNSDFFESLEINKITAKKYEEFCSRFEWSNIYSIDKFLNLNPQYKNEGKLAISYIIKEHEINCHDSRQLFAGNNENWIQYLYNNTIKTVDESKDIDKVELKDLYFCTFNYDRILEYSLIASLVNTFWNNKNVPRHESQEILDYYEITIDHVYGKIGDFKINPFERSSSSIDIRTYYNDILLINEREKDMTDIINNLLECERIFFLGYGFNEENNEILKLENIMKNKKGVSTGIGINNRKLSELKNRFNLGIYNSKSLETLSLSF